MTISGVDVASFQGVPSNWVSAAGKIEWAAVKITELEANGTRYVNPYAKADWDWLRANKKSRVAYTFGHPSISATDTVNFFLSELNGMGLHDDDAVALDLEVTDGLSAAQVAAWGASVQSQLHSRLGRPPLLYTFINFAKDGNCAGLGGYPLWIADPSSPAGSPQVPAPWTHWAIHQYDISGNIDRDVANYASQAAMIAALGRQKAAPPPPPPDPKPVNLGGDVSAMSATRWPTGQAVVAGINTDGYVWRVTWDNTKWGGWGKVSPSPAKGSVSLTSWGDGSGQLYYIEAAGNTVQMTTSNYGDTWT